MDLDFDTTPRLRTVNYVDHICKPISTKIARISQITTPAARVGTKLSAQLVQLHKPFLRESSNIQVAPSSPGRLGSCQTHDRIAQQIAVSSVAVSGRLAGISLG